MPEPTELTNEQRSLGELPQIQAFFEKGRDIKNLPHIKKVTSLDELRGPVTLFIADPSSDNFELYYKTRRPALAGDQYHLYEGVLVVGIYDPINSIRTSQNPATIRHWTFPGTAIAAGYLYQIETE